MSRYFGLDRVIEPKGLAPATAWKLDNHRKLNSLEARINLELIHLEWDNFQQLCSSCAYDEHKIKAKIIDIIEKRGKLQNPFTATGGVLIGTIDEISEDLISENGLVKGERIYCMTSLSCVPIHIDEIEEIDFNYGQIKCSGYAILFEASPVYRLDEGLSPDYTLAAIDEAGSLFGAYQVALANQNRNIVIIGRNTYTTIVYAGALREAMGEEGRIFAVMNSDVQEALGKEEIRECMAPLIEETYFVSVTEPVNAYKELMEKQPLLGQADQVIVAESLFGGETLGVMLTKPFGNLYFTAVENHYAEAQLVAESMGKIINIQGFDQYIKDYPEFTINLVKKFKHLLEKINSLYEEKNAFQRFMQNRPADIHVNNAGREDDFVYASNVTRSMVQEVLNVAKYDCNVIIQGETGVGKEKVLSLIHQNSERYAQPCIKINCATIAESLAESEFFGYEGGAFTGAQSSGKAGYFEMANGGILFLDEIGTLSMNMQSKLLRVLQENRFYRVGGTRQVSVNVRVIVANNVPIKELVDNGSFREDLYYRLNICKIDVPPLRDRRDDILCLAQAFMENWSKKYNIEKELSPGALSLLYQYSWPGNVRELENIIHRLIISSKGVIIEPEEVEDVLNENTFGDLILNVRRTLESSDDLNFHQIMEQQEKQIIEYAMKKEGTTRKAADFLGLPQTTFSRKKLKYGL